MGNSSSFNPTSEFLEPVQELLESGGLKVSAGTIVGLLEEIDRVAPWFGVSGNLTIDSWEKLGRDLDRANAEGVLSRGARPLWRMIHSCLREGKCEEIIQRGRRALVTYQDSVSEAKKFRDYRIGLSKKKKKEKRKRNDASENQGLYSVLDEFKELDISKDKQDPEEEEDDLEEAIAEYEGDRYGSGRPPPFNPSAATAPLAAEGRAGCNFIPKEAWSDFASAFPVFENPATRNRFYEPIDYKHLKDLAEAAKRDGITANYTIMLLQRLTRNALTPTDWQDIAKACLSMGQFLDWKSIVTELAHSKARENAQNGQPDWTADMLLGQGQWVNDQTAFPIQVYEQINALYLKAWRALPNKGEVTGNLTKIIQGSTEPFSDFVARMMEAAGRIFGDVESAMPLVKQLVFEQCTKDCRRAITPWKGKDIEAWMKACREIGGPLSNAGLAAAVLAATRGGKKTYRSGVCFQCGKPGHIKRQCRNTIGSAETYQTQGARTPGICPRCKRGKHWANECRSIRDINGQPIQPSVHLANPKNGTRAPWSQGPKIFGAHEEVTLQPPRPREEPRQAPQGWTSVPPPTWF